MQVLEPMSEETQKLRDCPLCHQTHESAMLYGMEFIPCPEMPENMIMPRSTLRAFMAGDSMLDQPFILVK